VGRRIEVGPAKKGEKSSLLGVLNQDAEVLFSKKKRGREWSGEAPARLIFGVGWVWNHRFRLLMSLLALEWRGDCEGEDEGWLCACSR